MNPPPFNPEKKNNTRDTVPAQESAAQNIGKKKANPYVVAGAAAGAAVLGVGATAAAMGLGHDNEEAASEDIDIDANAEEIEIGGPALNPDQPSNNSFHFDSEHDSQPSAFGEQQENTLSSETHQEQNISIQEDDVVNPNEIISITAVDDEDNDMPELVEFEELEYVNDGSGHVQVHADFTIEGENFTMIDIDGDGIFDGIIDDDGTMAGVNTGGLMVSDVEMMTHDNDDYLAAHDMDNNTDINGVGESSDNDTILV